MNQQLKVLVCDHRRNAMGIRCECAAGLRSFGRFRLDESSQTLTLLGTISDGLTANSGLQGLAAH
jgi:hypothetical protein